MFCEKCQKPAITSTSFLDEKTNGAESKIEVQRGFCPTCGAVLRPINPNFILAVYNLSLAHLNAHSILERGDTFSQMWVLLPTYREIFNAANGKFSIRILSRTTDPFETGIGKTKYETVYEEVLETPEIFSE